MDRSDDLSTFEYDSLDAVAEDFRNPVVTIGNFDGLHRGHRQILEVAKRRASELNRSCICVTFEPHPVRFFHREAPPFRLSPRRQKSRLLAEQQIDAVLIIEFTEEIAEQPPEAFVNEMLAAQLDAAAVVVGEDFRFGKERAGDTDMLQDLCDESGIETKIVAPVEHDGQRISSTWIRKELSKGNLDVANFLLNHPFALSGNVVEGEGRGAKLGFPTANLECGNQLIPPKGVYATRLIDGETAFPSVTNIGVRPTFDEKNLTIETHVLDRDDLELYDKQLDVEFLTFLRPEKAFEDVDQLKAQIQKDIQGAREYFQDDV